MSDNKLNTITNLFEKTEIRSIWDSEKEDYYFSAVDVIKALTESPNSRNYWKVLKHRMIAEGNETVTNCNQLKLQALDGKYRSTDVLNTEGIFRLIESVPSPKAEPFKMWLASLGKERIDEVFDPEIAINRAVSYYRKKGYTDEWIKNRVNGILNRKSLTDVWQDCGITEDYEYAMLTNEIYKSWSGMSASEYKVFKGLRKESLRDNMTDIEVILTDLGELTTRDIAKNEHPQGLKENLKVAARGGTVSKIAKESYEKETSSNAISSENAIGVRYENNKQIENLK